LRKERAARLRAAGVRRLSAALEAQLGKPVSVLVEAQGRGHTEAFASFRFTGEAPPAGRVVEAIADEVADQALLGRAAA
jgi:tRNA A37 methylthiotransferase MiaB